MIEVLAVIGILLSLYAFYVEIKSLKSAKYKAVCDISNKVSCSRAFSSKYGKTFGISNSIYGMVFYIIILSLAVLNQINYIFYLSLLAVIGSIYLAYLLYFKLKDFCIVCTLIYIINILLLIFSYGGAI